ncbi:anthranilate synthase component I family protein [Helicobacter sp. MIT 14-3879]|uniref:anthranilate synthase component I family protein n=1 Tax=Helicobacter sp. MIT 14-3879 TaxID=2040649 RepID=UPI000E1F0483|nr:anthranilate synthase component I family protein [Helicobacter sp. MIT 14-3879]RDU62849.1 anthranilate synthase component I [Helicobacter sp. MIT 14-3879]
MYPSIEIIKNMNLRGYKRFPLIKEIYADFITPIEAMRILKINSTHCFLLESVEQKKHWGRYTFLGFNPTLQITAIKGKVSIQEGSSIKESNDIKLAIREILSKYKTPKIQDLPIFTGGLVGFFSYDYIRYNETRLDFDLYDSDFLDVDLMLFNDLIVFDNFKQKIMLIAGVILEDLENSYKNAIDKIENIEALLKKPCDKNIEPFYLDSTLKYDFSESKYFQMVKQAKQYIYEGDIFQVVLSNAMRGKARGSLFDVYRVLRTINPSPYMFYFSSNNIEIAGASPETLVRLQDSKLYTYPLAGSRKRGQNAKEDELLKEELLNDTKELAEHNMLVDLGRNDIGKVSKIGSVEVEKYMNVEQYSHIMHISSTICGEIRDDKDALDALDAILPAGTLSGAPKIRACEIINELEGNSRGIYGGSIGYLDFSGNMDMCIAIRLVYKKDNNICVRSGAGVVYDSEPKSEFLECNNKAKALLDALNLAQGGLE